MCQWLSGSPSRDRLPTVSRVTNSSMPTISGHEIRHGTRSRKSTPMRADVEFFATTTASIARLCGISFTDPASAMTAALEGGPLREAVADFGEGVGELG